MVAIRAQLYLVLDRQVIALVLAVSLGSPHESEIYVR